MVKKREQERVACRLAAVCSVRSRGKLREAMRRLPAGAVPQHSSSWVSPAGVTQPR